MCCDNLRFDELKSQLKADQVERIAEISVKDDQHIVAYIKQALYKGVAQQKAKESRGKSSWARGQKANWKSA